MAFFNKSRKADEEDEDVYIDEEDEDIYEDEEDEDSYEDEEESGSSGKKGKGKTVGIIIAVCLVLLIAVAAVLFLRSNSKKKQAEKEGWQSAYSQEDDLYTVVSDEAPGSGKDEEEQEPGGTEKEETPAAPSATAPAATTAPQASAPPAAAAAAGTAGTAGTAGAAGAAADSAAGSAAASSAAAASSRNWDIDKDLVVYECILDQETQTKYLISFAEFDAAGNIGTVYAFKDFISPSKMGSEFSDNSALPYWFFPGGHVHVKANSDLSECIVTKAAS